MFDGASEQGMMKRQIVGLKNAGPDIREEHHDNSLSG